ncbi:hypothetical protein C1645_818605 [Glomus cerebriforme]|uniref:BTB/POZ protein n=1 Tax=Glomus cerebriforme TaxID=658196 RepID=A0A397T857_9GLOM|nr:hypothetical protein C1645_818605 [Glomus cerebriforme]
MSIYWKELVNDYEKLLETGKGYEVIIYAGENENIEEIYAHSTILCARSQYFCTAFSNVWAYKKDGKFIFEKPNISSHLFKMILRYIYTGKIDLTQLKSYEILQFLMAIDELIIESLVQCIQEYVIEHKCEFLHKYSIEILELTYQNGLFINLWDLCLNEICEEPEKLLINSDKFINLKAPVLEIILRHDDFALDEIIIWNNMSRTTSKYFKRQNFFRKVYPYKKLLPKRLVYDILEFHMIPGKGPNFYDIRPSRVPTCDSIIIYSRHLAIFACWIDRKKKTYYNVRNLPYKFRLLYRATRDGFSSEAFHEKCDDKGMTISVAKIKDSDQIIGGYNPLEWESKDNYKSTTSSFIFSFKDGKKTAKVSYPNNKQYAIHNSSEDYEVFQVIKV